jgi:hypothetical protein
MQEILQKFHEFSNQVGLYVLFIWFYIILSTIMFFIGTWFMKGFRAVKSKIKKRMEARKQELQPEEIETRELQ